jgi:flagellar hook-associated protein 1 FlgK
VAQALSDLRLEKSLGGGSQTIEEFYSDLIGRIGAEAQEALNDASTQRLIQDQVTTRRENVRGVSINEEAADLILFQRAYQAAARIITTVDELLQTALNM